MSQTVFSTQAFARRASVSVRTLRFYDSRGLLRPSRRTQDGQRLYNDAKLLELYHVRTLQFLGFGLAESAVFKRDEPRSAPAKLAYYAFSLHLRREQLSRLLTVLERAKALLKRDEPDWRVVTEPLQALQQGQRRSWFRRTAAQTEPLEMAAREPADKPTSAR